MLSPHNGEPPCAGAKRARVLPLRILRKTSPPEPPLAPSPVLNATVPTGQNGNGSCCAAVTPVLFLGSIPQGTPGSLQITLGAGERIALTHFHTYDHSPIFTARFRFWPTRVAACATLTSALMSDPHPHHDQDGFLLRGLAFSRLDAFSDVVFGFALTLLVVSLEVPHTFAELHTTLRGFFPFAVCFTLLSVIWHGHYKFFRRFGLHDLTTITLNFILLFVILFYVYPLKFLFTFVVLGPAQRAFEEPGQLSELMVLYGVGFAAIYFLQAALYYNGYRHRELLQLSPLELILTRGYIAGNVGMTAIGLLSALFAILVPQHDAGYAGLLYFLILPLRRIQGARLRRRTAALQSAAQLEPADAD